MAQHHFYPHFSYISDISNSTQAVVTFTAIHDFTPGEIVSFRVGKQFGMYEINNQRAKVILKDDTSIVTDIDTSTWNSFSLDNLNTPGTSPPVCVPSSSSVVPFEYNPMVNIEDAFDNRIH